MITDGQKIKADQLIKDIERLQSRFTKILIDASKVKNENDLTSEMMSLDPEEWERVMIILKHLEFRRKQWNDLKEEQEVKTWLELNASMLGLARDLLLAYESQLDFYSKPHDTPKGHEA